MKLFLLFSHTLTPEQIEDAKASLEVEEFVYLPQNLQSIWSQIPSKQADITSLLDPIREFLTHNAFDGDYVLIQGDFGASYQMVNFAKELSLIPIYSTNKRESIEEIKEGQVIKQSIFIHSIYRRY